jgi:hypothetical protein
MSGIILPPDSQLFRTFQRTASEKRLIFFAGLPGTGKSLFLKQMSLMAAQGGRTVHLLQYDVARPPFETAENMLKYPEIDGFTHAAIRMAVGMWARSAVMSWHQQFPDPAHLLVGEVPLVGNRLVELAQQHGDEAEALLQEEGTVFLLPVPSLKIRGIIESAREESMSQPRHEREKQDAPPNVLRALWRQVAQIGYQLGVIAQEPSGEVAYDPELYAAVYRHLLRHRRFQILSVDTVLRPSDSAYDLKIAGTELSADADEVDRIMGQLEGRYDVKSMSKTVANWYQL